MSETVCACGFDAQRFEPRPEKVAGAMRWHEAVCTERFTLVDEGVTVDGVTYTADRVREIVRERHVLATELALCREQSATLRQQLDGACRAIVGAQRFPY